MSSNITQFRCVLVIAVACVMHGLAFASEDIPFKVVVAETLTHEDNVFRTSGSVAPSSDTINSTNVGVSLDTFLSRQRLQASLSRTDNRYQSLSILNHSGSSYQLAWQGTFPDRWTGAAAWSRSESLANYADLRNTFAKDVVTGESANFRLGYLPHPDLPIYVQVANGKSINSLANLAGNDLKTRSAEVGMQYQFPLGNQVSLLVRELDGRYPNNSSLVDNSYRQSDIQAAAQWKPSVKSALTLRIGHTRREQDGLPQGNFSGTTGNLAFDWALASKSSINVTLGREITTITAQDFTQGANALVVSSGIGARWAPTYKISVDAGINHQSREFGGIQSDTTTASSLVLKYVPTRTIQLSVQSRHEFRKSNNPILPYTSNVGMLNATLSF